MESSDVATAHAGLILQTSADDGRSAWHFSAFELRAVANKGLGAFARRAYKCGERLLAEAPLALLVVADRNRVQRSEGKSLIERVVGSLNSRRRAAYYALSQAEYHGRTPTALGIWLSNAYPLDEGDAGAGSRQAVFEQICRINHACAPNVAITWNAALRKQTVHASRAIATGEELTASFYGTDGSTGRLREERQRYFQSTFHFDCACTLCGLTGTKLAQSEARQSRLKAISQRLEASPAYPVMSKLVLEAAKLFGEEGLPAAWAKIYYLRLVGGAADAGDAEAAGKWASRAAACARDASGVDSDAYRAILQ